MGNRGGRMTESREAEVGGGTGATRLLAGAAAIDHAGGPERRHETLMERAQSWGVPRQEAEAVYELADEEGLEPELALLLVGTGVGVLELEVGDPALPEAGRQESPPNWVAVSDVAPAEAERERRLRLSFRRLHSLWAASAGSAAEAARRFLAEPDVVEDAY